MTRPSAPTEGTPPVELPPERNPSLEAGSGSVGQACYREGHEPTTRRLTAREPGSRRARAMGADDMPSCGLEADGHAEIETIRRWAGLAEFSIDPTGDELMDALLMLSAGFDGALQTALAATKAAR